MPREMERVMKNTKRVASYTEIIRAERKSWGAVNPVTKVIPDKRRKAPKYKKYED